MLTTFAFVFARGGSKGLPGKNVKPLGGVPLVARAINTASTVSRVSEIFVSTDDATIADIARLHGATVIPRPQELATDGASEWLAWQHATRWLQDHGQVFDVFLSLPATSPLRSVGDVDACLDSLDAATDMVITVTPAARSPWFNMVTRTATGESELVISSDIHRRQDAPPVFDMTTVAYVTRPDFILTNTGVFAGRVKSVVVPKERAVDIDDAYDFMVAEVLLSTAGREAP